MVTAVMTMMMLTGLSLSGRGWECLLANFMNRKIEEK